MDFASYVHQYYKSGYLVYQEAGEAGKVCVDHMNKTVPKSEVGRVLNKLEESMCNTLEYRDLVSIDIMVDNEQEVMKYFLQIEINSRFKSFLTAKSDFYILCHFCILGKRRSVRGYDWSYVR